MSAVVTRMNTRNWSAFSGESNDNAHKKQKTQVSKLATTPTRLVKKEALKNKSKTKAQKIIFDYNIDPYDHEDETLEEAVIEMLTHYDLLRHFSVSEATVRNFLVQVKSFYNPKNLFHNFKHVWGVMHLSFQLLTRGGDEYLFPLDIYATMIAALCHDIQHPGNNNAFEVATASDLSKVKSYNVDAGILERHHATITHSLLNAPGTDYDILKGLTEGQKEHFRRQVGLIILGTDMAKHPSILAEAKGYTRAASILRSETSIIEEEVLSSASAKSHSGNGKAAAAAVVNGAKKGKPSESRSAIMKCATNASMIAYADAKPLKQGGVDCSDPESRIAFTRVLVHTADIGAQTQCPAVARKWMDRCYGEFRSQAEREEILGIVTSPFLHDLKEEYKTFSAQCCFIEETVEPLWDAMSAFLPRLAFAREQLVVNKLGYKKMLEEYLSSHAKKAEC